MKTLTTALILTASPILLAAPAGEKEASDDPWVKPGELITPEKAVVYKLHDTNEIFKKYDTNRDGYIDPKTEGRNFLEEVNKDAKKDMARYGSIMKSNAEKIGRDVNQPMTMETLNYVAVIEEPKTPKTSEHFRLRATIDDFSQPVGKDDPLSKVNPAQFSFTRDYLNDADEWAAKGAVGGFWQNEATLSSLSIGAEFERVATDIPGNNDVDSLTFKVLGGKTHVYDPPAGVAAFAWNAGATYATNFDFEGGLLGVSAQFEPLFRHPAYTGVWSVLGNEGQRSAANSLGVGLRNFIRIEGGGTVDDFPKLPVPLVDDDYLRAGAQLEATIWPFGFDGRLKFTTSYGYYAELLGDGPDYKNFSAGAEYQLDDEGHFSLRAEYNNGRVPMLLTDRETLLLSLSVRY